MVHSMTAYARADQEIDDGLVLTWELKSVNHRFLEAQFRMPEQLRELEHDLRELLRRHLQRGKVDCTLRAEAGGSAQRLQLNRSLLLQILAILEQVRRDAPEVGAPSGMDILRWPGMLAGELALDAGALKEPVSDLFESALADLIAHRHREGVALRDTLTSRLDAIDGLVEQIRRQTVSAAHQVQQRLRQRLADLQANVETERLEQEVALLASRGDVAEELDRLRIHVEEARSNLRGSGPHGRRLDFLTQELNREANTVGAKALLAETSQRAVDLKVVIEQIREQVQNLE
ncbi:MAG: YicC/YloC family endoribonuclease [Pseudomonadales bacterium]